MATKQTSKPAVKKRTRAREPQTVGESIIQGLKEAIAWTKVDARVDIWAPEEWGS